MLVQINQGPVELYILHGSKDGVDIGKAVSFANSAGTVHDEISSQGFFFCLNQIADRCHHIFASGSW